jgi:hypothetical protein
VQARLKVSRRRFDDRRLECLLAKLRYPQLYLAGLGLQLALVMPSTGIATGFAALVALRINSRSASESRSAFNVSSTLARTTRSRWFLIRSSSIVMTLPRGRGVVSLMAAPFLLSWLRLATKSSVRFGAASLTQLCERFCTSSYD